MTLVMVHVIEGNFCDSIIIANTVWNARIYKRMELREKCMVSFYDVN